MEWIALTSVSDLCVAQNKCELIHNVGGKQKKPSLTAQCVEQTWFVAMMNPFLTIYTQSQNFVIAKSCIGSAILFENIVQRF